MKYFVVSDTHDHYLLMIEALNKQGFDPECEDHKLIVCGDAFYSGPEPGKMFEYLKTLKEKDKLVFINGNHDRELLEAINNKFTQGRPGNRRCAEGVVEHITGKTRLSNEELASECNKIGFTSFLKSALRYFETEHYVFTHGFIPVKDKKYNPDWRNEGSKSKFDLTDGMMMSMKYGIQEPGKIIVFGHYSAARCYVMKNATSENWEKGLYKVVNNVPQEGFLPFYGNTFIALDQSVKKTGFINCLIIED
ncbi:MAG: metallophosphoesterase [Clostridia bacterium]|nr:metallophosphoesterase [Clostridia bacterium]